ncbi:MAG: acylphosphatase [Chloroflexi bacterium]|nr:MAG: acylphosphatase [Chloroflexota bacterium]
MDERQPAHVRLHAIVHGRVQGVSFRYYTLNRARELGLAGYVRNRGDGSVEVVAEGAPSDLDQLLSFLRSGPRPAFVTEVEASWTAATGGFSRFEVRY